jgi:hypothetical protein
LIQTDDQSQPKDYDTPELIHLVLYRTCLLTIKLLALSFRSLLERHVDAFHIPNTVGTDGKEALCAANVHTGSFDLRVQGVIAKPTSLLVGFG